MTAPATTPATTAPQCCGGTMTPEIGFCSGRLFHRCPSCRHTDYGWWTTSRTLTEGN